MNNTLGKHVLIDFYNCKASFSEAEDLQPLVERAFDLVGDLDAVHPDQLHIRLRSVMKHPTTLSTALLSRHGSSTALL